MPWADKKGIDRGKDWPIFIVHLEESIVYNRRGGELKKNAYPIVYSTEQGRIRPADNKPQKSTLAGDGIVRIGRETKGRKGKGVTIIFGVPLDPAGLKALAQELKRECGSGGTVKDGRIEIQGDHRDKLGVELANRGWPVKRSGG